MCLITHFGKFSEKKYILEKQQCKKRLLLVEELCVTQNKEKKIAVSRPSLAP